MDAPARLDVSWATSTLLRLTNADGLVVWQGGEDGGKVVCTRGLLRQLPSFSAGAEAILAAVGAAWPAADEALDAYCATRRGLEAFPEGALPLAVVPKDAEAVMTKPLPGGGLLVLWSALPRAFDRAADRLWVALVAEKLGAALHADTPIPQSSGVSSEQCFEPDLLGGNDGETKSRDPFARFGQQVRIFPGAIGLLGMLIQGYNRIALMSLNPLGIDPGQSRADLVAGSLAATLFMQGVVWLSETPATPELEDSALWDGVETVERFERFAIESAARKEAAWIWKTLSGCARVSSMVVFWRGECVVQSGLFRQVDSGGAPPAPGAFCDEVMTAGRGRYLSMLKNYPAKVQFEGFLPEQTRGLVLTPLRAARNAPAVGLLVLGVDSFRGIGKVDQAWIGSLAEKLAVSMAAELDKP